MLVVRTLVTLGLFVCLLDAAAFGQTVAEPAQRAARQEQPKQINYVQVGAAQLLQRPTTYHGRRVALTAEVVSVNARRRSLDLYDQHTRALIGVSLADLPKAQRRQLAAEPIYHVTVYGLAEMQNGRMVLRAEQVMPVEMSQVLR
jgi:hypothetical protein